MYVTDISDVIGESKSQHALDVGCGTGFHTNALLQCGYKVSGVDFVPEMLTIAREAYPEVEFKWVRSCSNKGMSGEAEQVYRADLGLDNTLLRGLPHRNQ